MLTASTLFFYVFFSTFLWPFLLWLEYKCELTDDSSSLGIRVRNVLLACAASVYFFVEFVVDA